MRPIFEECERRALLAGELVPPTLTIIPVDTAMPVIESGGEQCDCAVTATFGPVITAPPAPNPPIRPTLLDYVNGFVAEVQGMISNAVGGTTPPTAPATPATPGPQSSVDEVEDGTIAGL